VFPKEKDYIGISVGEDSFKLLHMRTLPTNSRILNVVRQQVMEVPESDWAKTIRTSLNEWNVRHARAFLAIGSNIVTTKNIEIPSLDPNEIKSIIDLQAGRHTPYAREEILVGYITIGVFQRNYTQVLLVIAKRDLIKNYLVMLDAAGLQVEHVFFAPEGMAVFYAQVLNIKPEDPPIGIIDISSHSTEFLVAFNRTLGTCRHVPFGMQHLLQAAEDAKAKWIDELGKSLEAYHNEDINKPPQTYVLSCDDPKIKELQPQLEKVLKAKMKIVPYLDHVTADQSVMLKFVSEYSDESFLNLVGPGIHTNLLGIDLTPEEIKVQRALEEKSRDLFKLIVSVFIFLFFLILSFFSRQHFKGIYYSRLEKEYAKKQEQVLYLEGIAERTAIVKRFLNSRMISLQVMDELARLIPPEIYLQNIQMTENGIIQLEGISDAKSKVSDYIIKLESSDLLEQATIKSTTEKKDRGKTAFAFQIECKLKGAKEEPMLEKPESTAAPEALKPPES
jgi:Tfp pilus assembly PilM family ATPase